MKKKIGLILIIALITIMPCYAALGTDFKAPDTFQKSSIWDTAIYDIYSLKTDNNTQLTISEYTDDDYNLFFKTDTSNNYYVSDLNNNMKMGRDNELNDGYTMEIVEHNGQKYIVYITLSDHPTNDEIKDSAKYLDDFNKVNNVEAVAV